MFDNLILAGNLYLQSGNYNDALSRFLKAEELEKQNPDVLIGLIRSYSRLNAFDLASEKLNYFKEHYPNDQRIHLVMGEHLAVKGHTEESSIEFTKLVKVGIYRYEALQGLIRLYADSDDPSILMIIEGTIPLYEPENQAVLYKLLSDCLRKNGKTVAADQYQKLYAATSNENLKDYHSKADDQLDALEQALIEVNNLMENGEFGAAEYILSDASRRWPGERRVQELLKSCYMGIVEDVPINTVNNESQNSTGVNSIFHLDSSISGGIMTSIPPDANYSAEVEIYITSLLDITGKTEDYFKKMQNKFSAMQSRVIEESASGDKSGSNLKRNFDELRILVSESSIVCQKEVDALGELSPPENFVEFHEYLTDLTRQIGNAFVLIDRFIVYQEWSSYYKVMGILGAVNQRKENLIDLFDQAIAKEMSISQPVIPE